MDEAGSPADSGVDRTPEEPATQARAVCVGVLEAVATALADLAATVWSTAEHLRLGWQGGAQQGVVANPPVAYPPDGEHRCVMPRGAPVYRIYRCLCGTSYRLYPPTDARAVAQWREI